MIYPKFLKENSTIGVPAPSSGAYNELDVKKFKNAKKRIEEIGYKVQLSENIFVSKMERSADARTRAEEINSMFEDNQIDMLWCAEGGTFLAEILPYIDFEKITQNPKWVEGFSDPTTLIYVLTTKYDIATIYSSNFKSFGVERYDRNHYDNLEFLKGNIVKQKSFELFEQESSPKVTGLEGRNLTEKVEWKNFKQDKVHVRGRIIAGNIDCMEILAGTKFDGAREFIERYKEDGIIWGFDNFALSKEQLILTLWKFHQLGYFEHTKAIIFGRNYIEESFLGYNMKTCIQDSVISKLNIPIIYDADISHKSPCLNIINGAITSVYSENGEGEISFELI